MSLRTSLFNIAERYKKNNFGNNNDLPESSGPYNHGGEVTGPTPVLKIISKK